jgi:hypothetical protein
MKMKLLTRTLSLLALAATTLFFAGCGGDDPGKKPEEIELGKLAKTWNIVSAALDGTNRTAEFSNFKLTIAGTFDGASPEGPYDYSVSGSRPTPSPWPGAAEGNDGTWTFGGTPSTDSGLIARDDATAMTYTISGGQLTLNFTFNGTGYAGSAKTAQVNGNWTFIFN